MIKLIIVLLLIMSTGCSPSKASSEAVKLRNEAAIEFAETHFGNESKVTCNHYESWSSCTMSGNGIPPRRVSCEEFDTTIKCQLYE